MRQVRHPLVRRDVMGIFDHVLDTTRGDFAAAERRLDEIDGLLRAIAENPASGVRLDGPLAGWLARHGGRGRMITVVFRSDPEARLLYIALIAFGGRQLARRSRESAQLPGMTTAAAARAEPSRLV